MVYVAGCQPATVAGYRLADYDESYLAGRKRLEFIATAEGDGTVTWAPAACPACRSGTCADTGPRRAVQQQRALSPATSTCCMTGATTRLPSTPPASARGGGGRARTLPPAGPAAADDIPDEAAVRSLGFGPGRPFAAMPNGRWRRSSRSASATATWPTPRHPVLVGHYLGDTIVSAEARAGRAPRRAP